MKLGVCAGLEQAPVIKALGFDYVEENMFRIASLSELDFTETVRGYERLGIPVYAFNCFFGGDCSIYTDTALDEIRKYATIALRRAHALGGSICVIGSGKARAIPTGVSRELAEARFTDVVSLCSDLADAYGIRIAVEPLNSKETNLVNTVSEAAAIAKMTKRQNVGSLVDSFHFYLEGESDSGLFDHADTLIHAHIARPDRYAPKLADSEDVARWLKLLLRIGYRGALSVESAFLDFEAEITEAKTCFDRIGYGN